MIFAKTLLLILGTSIAVKEANKVKVIYLQAHPLIGVVIKLLSLPTHDRFLFSKPGGHTQTLSKH